MAYFSTKKHISTFEYRIHWNITFEKRIYSLRKNKIKKPIVQCAISAKKHSCLVARIVPYYTTGLHLLTYHILESYPSKDIAPGLSHVISH